MPMGTELKTSRPEFKNVRQPGIGGLALLLSLLFQVPGLADDADDWFESRIRPVLAGTCFRCHGDQKTGGELRVDSREALLKGGNSGPAIDLEQPSASLLLQAIRREADVAAMPPDASQKLRPEQVSDFQHWLESGAPWPSQSSRFATSQHWAYEPLRQAPLPSVTDRDWPQTTVDHFIRHAQEQRGLQPAPRAGARAASGRHSCMPRSESRRSCAGRTRAHSGSGAAVQPSAVGAPLLAEAASAQRHPNAARASLAALPPPSQWRGPTAHRAVRAQHSPRAHRRRRRALRAASPGWNRGSSLRGSGAGIEPANPPPHTPRMAGDGGESIGGAGSGESRAVPAGRRCRRQ